MCIAGSLCLLICLGLPSRQSLDVPGDPWLVGPDGRHFGWDELVYCSNEVCGYGLPLLLYRCVDGRFSDEMFSEGGQAIFDRLDVCLLP